MIYCSLHKDKDRFHLKEIPYQIPFFLPFKLLIVIDPDCNIITREENDLSKILTR